MSRWDDQFRCVKCDQIFSYYDTPGNEYPVTGAMWCDGCVEAAGRVVCYDCDEWIKRARGHPYPIDKCRPTLLRWYLCTACYLERILWDGPIRTEDRRPPTKLI